MMAHIYVSDLFREMACYLFWLPGQLYHGEWNLDRNKKYYLTIMYIKMRRWDSGNFVSAKCVDIENLCVLH